MQAGQPGQHTDTNPNTLRVATVYLQRALKEYTLVLMRAIT